MTMAKAMILTVMPDAFITSPARTNSGMARSGKESSPENICVATSFSWYGRSPTAMK